MKRLVAMVALLLSLLSVVSPFVMEWTRQKAYRAFAPDVTLPAALAHIKAKGITPELNDLLAKDPKPRGWKLAYVHEGSPLTDLVPGAPLVEGVVVAASRPELVGLKLSEAQEEMATGYATGTPVRAPDGKPYMVWSAGKVDLAMVELTTKASFVIWVLTWLSLAAWIYLDARERRLTSAPAWLLLGLLAGPLALAVWLIYRYTQEPQAKVCPGCGTDTVKGAVYCVRCGFALRPACPSCRRPVEHDWAHCAACGTDLQA